MKYEPLVAPQSQMQTGMLSALYDPPVCVVRRTSDQSIANNEIVVINFEATADKEIDTGGMFAAGSPTVLAVQRPGVYLITACVVFAASATGYRYVMIEAKSAYVARDLRSNLDTTTQALNTMAVVSLASGDTIRLVVRQTSGGALDVLTLDDYSPRLSAVWLRAS